MTQTEYKDKNRVDIFKSRDGLETKVKLKNGSLISVLNIAWDYDIGDKFTHITIKVSPNVDRTTNDFSFTNEIRKY